MERVTKFRVVVLLVLLAVLVGFFGFRAYSVQVVNAASSDSSISTYTYYTPVSAARGQILDRNGNILVSNRASYNLIINSYVLYNSENPNESLRQLLNLCQDMHLEYAEHLPISLEKPYEYRFDDYPETWQSYFKQYLSARNWDSDISAQQVVKLMKSSYHIPNSWSEEDCRRVIGLRYELELVNVANLPTYALLSDVDSDILAKLMELNVPGMSVETTTVREYNTTYAPHILGRTGPIYAEEYEAYKEKGYAMNAIIGKDGLEAAFEDYLHGEDGVRVTTVASDGLVLEEYYSKEPQAGANVETTLDIGMQAITEKALAECIENLNKNGIAETGEGKDAKAGAVVVMDVKRGEVLSCASYPTFHIATFSEDYKALEADERSPMWNRALLATYPPGSIYKMITSIAAVDSDTLSPGYSIEDKGVYTYYDSYQPVCHIWTSSHGKATHGVVDLPHALSVSCNYYFYEAGRLTGIDAIDEVAAAMGLGQATGAELLEEVGYRANADTKAILYADQPDLSGWYKADTLAAAIGQSENRITPLQLCVYASTLANRGTRYRATFLKKVISADYQQLLEKVEPQIVSTYEISDTAYDAVIRGMRLAATEGSARTYLQNYPVSVCAKTGTAQHGSGGSDNASLLVFAPADDPQIAIAIYVEKGAQGGNLGSIAVDILDHYFSQETINDTYPTEGTLQ